MVCLGLDKGDELSYTTVTYVRHLHLHTYAAYVCVYVRVAYVYFVYAYVRVANVYVYTRMSGTCPYHGAPAKMPQAHMVPRAASTPCLVANVC
jgi:hypothetical protein